MAVQLENAAEPASLIVSWDAINPGDKSALQPAKWRVVLGPTNSVHDIPDADTSRVPGTQNGRRATVRGLEVGVTYTADVQAVNIDGTTIAIGTSAGCKLEPTAPGPYWRISSLAVTGGFVVTAAIMLIAGISEHSGKRPGYAVLFDLSIAFMTMGIATGLLTLAGWGEGGGFGMWRMIIGTDRRVSTSYVSTTMWTFLVAFALAYFTARSWLFDPVPHLFDGINPGGTGTGDSTIWDSYLILLGGPFAALVLARGVVSARLDQGKLQKTVADDGTASLKQALTDDSGNVDLVDSQYLIFNIVAFVYVLVGLASHDQLPTIPGLLLALTSSSAATYVVNKAVQSSAPTIAAVRPARARAGDAFSVFGTNLRADAAAPPTVTIGGVPALVDAASATGTFISATVGLGTPQGVQPLEITTSARITVKETMEILSDEPAISSILPPGSVRSGSEIKILGSSFFTVFDPGRTVTVSFTDSAEAVTAAAAPADGVNGYQSITVRVPDDMAPGTGRVKVTTPSGKTSVDSPLTVRP